MAKEEESLRHENEQLRQKLANLSSSISSQNISIQGLKTLLLRVDNNGSIIYANAALISYAAVSKEDLIGKDFSILEKFFNTDIMKVLHRPEEGATNSQTARDGKGGTFEIRTSVNNGLFDITLQDISDEHRFKTYVQKYISADLANLTDEDLSTFRYPERRFMTVSFTDLRGFTAMSESLTPEEVRTTMNAYLEEIIHAIDENKATVDKIVGDEVMALYGAPKHYKDHALRAVKTCCEQIFNLKALQRSFARIGKEMPDCGIGINTGDMVIGNMGSSTRQDYTVLSSAVNLAARLCSSALGAEVILTEATLNEVLIVMPKNWESATVQENNKESDENIRGNTEGIFPLPDQLNQKVIYIGPDVKKDLKNATYRFQYLHAIKVKGIEETIPVIAVTAPSKMGETIELNDNDVVVTEGEKVFGKYRLQELIGKGGMGEVWKARDAFGNNVAIKMLLAGEGASELQVRRFKREAEAMSRLDHRGICRILEVGEVEGVTYITMELIEGVSLSKLLHHVKGDDSFTTFDTEKSDISTLIKSLEKDSSANELLPIKTDLDKVPEKITYNTLPLQQTLSIVCGVCEAIQYAHERGILHRDLSPGNIMLRLTGDPVVMDFGLAKLESGQDSHSLSLEGQIFGTIEYMAPEQAASSKDVTEKADVYSLGAILYQMIAGHKMFVSSGNILADVQRLQEQIPKPPKVHNRLIETDLNIISLKAVRLMPEERYSSAVALKEDLDRYRRGEVIAAKSATTWEVLSKALRRNKTISSTIVASIIILLSLTMWFIWSLNKERNEAIKALREKNLEQAKREKLEDQNKVAAAREWQLVLEEDFSDETLFKKRWQITGTNNVVWRIEKGQLIVSGGASQRVKLLDSVLEKLDTTEIRIDFECHQESEFLNDITCEIDNYSLVYGGKGNTINKLEYINGPGSLWENKPDSPPIKRSKQYKVRAERINNHLRYQINGKTLFDIIDKSNSTANKQINLYSWKAEVWYDNIKIYKLGIPRSADLIEIAQQHFQRGNYSTAKDLYNDVLDATNEKERRQKAEEGLRTIAALSDKEKFLTQYRLKLKKAWPGKTPKITLKENGGIAIYIKSQGIKDLSPLKGMPVVELNCDYNPITSLEPLSDMLSLKVLHINHNHITSLNPLKELINLEVLYCYRNKITSLEPLRNLKKLRSLACDINQITSLAPLKDLKEMNAIWCQMNRLTSLAPLKDLSKLQYLNCSKNYITSLEPLKDLNWLNTLICSENKITSLAPLKNMKSISTLKCSENKIPNLESLRELTHLKSLDCSMNKIDSLNPLSLLTNVKSLKLGGNKITNLTALKNLVNLTYLDCHTNQLTSLTPITNLKGLQTIDCSFNLLTSIDPLKELSLLKILNCSSNKISSLSSLSKVPLDKLYCSGNPLTGLKPFFNKPPSKLFLFDCKTLPEKELKNAAKTWLKTAPEASKAARILLAIRKGDVATLKKLSVIINKRKILAIPRLTTWKKANDECQKLGGRLVIPKNHVESKKIEKEIAVESWIGIYKSNSKLITTSKEQLTYSPFYSYHNWDTIEGGAFLAGNGFWFINYLRPKTLYGYIIEWE